MLRSGPGSADRCPITKSGASGSCHTTYATKKRSGLVTRARGAYRTSQIADITGPDNTAIGRALVRNAVAKRRRALLQAPLGGSYQIPQEGQLQIITKNPNKTAVKLYLIPYDLTGMEPHRKTCIRRCSNSAGPILDKPLSADAQSQQKFDSLQDKHILRYFIHLKICCLSKDRFYLYDKIRVVSANRVPDCEEKLRTATQLPNLKCSPYELGKDESRSTSETHADNTDYRQIFPHGTPASPRSKMDDVDSLPLFVSDERRLLLAPLSTSCTALQGTRLLLPELSLLSGMLMIHHLYLRCSSNFVALQEHRLLDRRM